MSDIKLFHIQDDSVTQLEVKSATLERDIQKLIEQHLKALFAISLSEDVRSHEGN